MHNFNKEPIRLRTSSSSGLISTGVQVAVGNKNMAMDIKNYILHNQYLVINADDFGLSRKVNEGILTAHKKGCLTSTSLMANGPMFQQGIEMSRSVPRLGVGVHLNLVRGKPISKLQLVNCQQKSKNRR